jgi:hypothetical protein
MVNVSLIRLRPAVFKGSRRWKMSCRADKPDGGLKSVLAFDQRLSVGDLIINKLNNLHP